MISLTINGAKRDLDVDPQMPLLWALRDTLNTHCAMPQPNFVPVMPSR